jgi:hypothetical protein
MNDFFGRKNLEGYPSQKYSDSLVIRNQFYNFMKGYIFRHNLKYEALHFELLAEKANNIDVSCFNCHS